MAELVVFERVYRCHREILHFPDRFRVSLQVAQVLRADRQRRFLRARQVVDEVQVPVIFYIENFLKKIALF